jgi:hypothetical protein
MPILSRRSSLPRSALMRVIASRIRSEVEETELRQAS